MKSDVNGVSTCQEGQESYEFFADSLVQYDYRFNGELFSCVAKSLDHARMKRDAWFENKRNGLI